KNLGRKRKENHQTNHELLFSRGHLGLRHKELLLPKRKSLRYHHPVKNIEFSIIIHRANIRFKCCVIFDINTFAISKRVVQNASFLVIMKGTNLNKYC